MIPRISGSVKPRFPDECACPTSAGPLPFREVASGCGSPLPPPVAVPSRNSWGPPLGEPDAGLTCTHRRAEPRERTASMAKAGSTAGLSPSGYRSSRGQQQGRPVLGLPVLFLGTHTIVHAWLSGPDPRSPRRSLAAPSALLGGASRSPSRRCHSAGPSDGREPPGTPPVLCSSPSPRQQGSV